MAQERKVPLILLGLGNVGQALLRQILDARRALVKRHALDLPVIGVADSQALLFNPQGLPYEHLLAALKAKSEGQSLAGHTESLPRTDLSGLLQPGALLLDLTAATDTTELLSDALDVGCGVVLANKHPLSGGLSNANLLLKHPNLRYEATVGAGLPAIRTLRMLLDAGELITSVEGCLSGTLGYLCTQLEAGVPYAEAVGKAHALGYTEPDPRQDLSGQDVARKALILGRTIGWQLEMGDLYVEPLYPPELSGVSPSEFLDALANLNEDYIEMSHNARAHRQALRYVAQIQPEAVRIGLQAVDQNSLLGALRGPANYIAYYSERYAEEPLIISGPGAGADVTASGILADIVDLALYRNATLIR
jgi:homoserine dehydrogenase